MEFGTLWAQRRGRGEPVLMVAGLGYASWCWDGVVMRLAERFDTVCVDNRGSGRSARGTGPLSIESMAEDALGVLEQLGISSAHILGHSMGGYIALAAAKLAPQRVRSLVLVGTSAGGKDSDPVPPSTLDAWKAAAHLAPQEFARRTMPLSYAPGWAQDHPQAFESYLAQRLAFPTAPQAWQDQFDACEVYLGRGLDAAGIDVPTLVIHGTEDRIIPYANGERLGDQLPQGSISSFQGGGHLCFLEDPPEFCRRVHRFLTSVAGRRDVA